MLPATTATDLAPSRRRRSTADHRVTPGRALCAARADALRTLHRLARILDDPIDEDPAYLREARLAAVAILRIKPAADDDPLFKPHDPDAAPRPTFHRDHDQDHDPRHDADFDVGSDADLPAARPHSRARVPILSPDDLPPDPGPTRADHGNSARNGTTEAAVTTTTPSSSPVESTLAPAPATTPTPAPAIATRSSPAARRAAPPAACSPATAREPTAALLLARAGSDRGLFSIPPPRPANPILAGAAGRAPLPPPPRPPRVAPPRRYDRP
jgi:hypothetical protein